MTRLKQAIAYRWVCCKVARQLSQMVEVDRRAEQRRLIRKNLLAARDVPAEVLLRELAAAGQRA